VNRKLTARERWLLTAVPALAVLAVYGFGVYHPQQALLANAQQQLDAARHDSVTKSEVAAKRQVARSLQNRADTAKRDLSGNMPGPQVKMAKGLIVSDESQALAKVTNVFKQRSILVVASTRLSDSDARNVMPAGLGEAVKSIPGQAKGGSHGGVWRMEMVGNFGDLCASLSAIDALDVLVLPFSISMEPCEDGGRLHRWSLWVWM
jgi:hypothetical protein